MSSSFEAKDYELPSKSKPCVDDNQLLSSNQIPAKSYHNLSSNYQTSLKSPPQHQRPTEADPLKDHRLSNNHNQPPPPSQQQLPAPTPYSNVEQPNKDNHVKLTSAEPPETVQPKSKNYLSQPDGSPLRQQPPTPTLPSNIEKPEKQPITLAKLTSAEPVTNIHPKKELSQKEAPPSQPISPDQHILKNPPLPPPSPSPSPSPQTRTLSSNVDQPTKYKQPTNQVTCTEPKTDYPEHFLLQPDGPPPPQPYPLPRTLSPKDQLKNVKTPAARNPPPKKGCCTCSIL